MGVHDHKRHAPGRVRVFGVTVSDSRTDDTDDSGRLMRQLVMGAGHEVAGYRILKDEPAPVAALIREIAAAGAADALVTNGGTGISARDSTYEAVQALLDKRLDGFGEIFRMLSYQEIGAAAMLSRAVGGVHRGLIVFALPGSPAAVELALSRLILPELGHLVFELRKGSIEK